jgi:hypothetical protein
MPIRFLSVDIMRGDIFLAAAFVIFGDRSAHRKFMEFSRSGGKDGLMLLCRQNESAVAAALGRRGMACSYLSLKFVGKTSLRSELVWWLINFA